MRLISGKPESSVRAKFNAHCRNPKHRLTSAAITVLVAMLLSGCEMEFGEQFRLANDGESLIFGKVATAELRWLYVEVYEKDVGPFADMLRNDELWHTDYYGRIALHLLAGLLEISPTRDLLLLEAQCVTVSALNHGWMGGETSESNPNCVTGSSIGRP